MDAAYVSCSLIKIPGRYFNFSHDGFLLHFHQLLITHAINGHDIAKVPFNKSKKTQTHTHTHTHTYTKCMTGLNEALISTKINMTKRFQLYSRQQNVNTASTMSYIHIYIAVERVRGIESDFIYGIARPTPPQCTMLCVIRIPSSFVFPSVTVQLK